MLLLLLLTLSLIKQGLCVCFFPYEYQGLYNVQMSLNGISEFKYTEVAVIPDGIAPWGTCHWKFENTVVLLDTTGGTNCMRCFHLYLRSSNIMQAYTEISNKCYSNLDDAIESCVAFQDIPTRRAREVTMYKNSTFKLNDGRINRVMCPFVGKFAATYTAFHNQRKRDMCVDFDSVAHTCPMASQFQFNFTECTFGQLLLNWECLGHWTGFDGNNYIAIKDTRAETKQPVYRCGMYYESKQGRISLSLSIDSSCQEELLSPWQGYETILLSRILPPALPSGVYTSCSFPEWAQGQWQDMVVSGNLLTYRENSIDRAYNAMCLRDASPIGERFALFTRDQCDNEAFTCIWLKKRSTNVMEMKIAPMTNYLNVSKICSDTNFWNPKWRTQGREIRSVYECPVSGEHTGILPDDPTLCARLASDCTNPHIMKYQIYPCNNDTIPYEGHQNNTRNRRDLKDWRYTTASDPYHGYTVISSEILPPVKPDSKMYVYADKRKRSPVLKHRQTQFKRETLNTFTIPPGTEIERVYQCLGGWEEGGIRYTYTWRSDVDRYECFAGVKASDDEIFIAEAGGTCKRGMQPLTRGMKMVRRGSCTMWEETAVEVGSNWIHYMPLRQKISAKSPRWSHYGDNEALLSSATSLSLSAILFVCLIKIWVLVL